MPETFNLPQFCRTIAARCDGLLVRDTAGGPATAARRVQALAEATCRDLVGSDDAIACRAGCAHCCIVNVSVLPPEATVIADYLSQHRSPAERDTLLERLTALEHATRWLDDEERIMSRQRCAFLDAGGSCTIYPVRPLLCRAITSTDAENCRETLAMLAFDENRPIVVNLLQQSIFEAAFSSLGAALKRHGHASRSLRLTGAVRAELASRHLAAT